MDTSMNDTVQDVIFAALASMDKMASSIDTLKTSLDTMSDTLVSVKISLQGVIEATSEPPPS
jgi:hypothetical protein